MVRIFVGVSGRIGAGKDEFASVFAATLRAMHIPARTDSFAAPLRAVCKEVLWDGTRETKERQHRVYAPTAHEALRVAIDKYLPKSTALTAITSDMLYWLEGHGYVCSPREFMVQLGEVARGYDKDYWVKAAVERHKEAFPVFGITVLADVRHDNEAEAMTINVVVERPVSSEAPLVQAGMEGYKVPPHLLTYVVDNSGTQGQFHVQAAAQAVKLAVGMRHMAPHAGGVRLNDLLSPVVL